MIEVDVEQGSREWFELHKGIPSASNFEDIITPARGELSESINLYIGRIIARENDPLRDSIRGESFSTYWTERGIAMETEAAAWYQLKTGFDCRHGGMIFNDDKTAAVSPDLRVVDDQGKKGMVEIKCLSPDYHIAYLLEDGMPKRFWPQVHGGLAIADEYGFTDFLMYCPGYKEKLIRVTRNAYTGNVARALQHFDRKLRKARQEIVK